MSDVSDLPQFQTVTIAGNSMDRAGLMDGMRVKLRRKGFPRSGDVVVAVLADGSETIKRLRRSRGQDGEVIAWLVPVSSDPRHDARRMREGDYLTGVLDLADIEPRQHLTRPPYTFKGRQFWDGVRAPKVPPPPQTGAAKAHRLHVPPLPTPRPASPPPRQVPRYYVARADASLFYVGEVGGGSRLAFSAPSGRVAVPREMADPSTYAARLEADDLRAHGVGPGDTLLIQRNERVPRRWWPAGEVVAAQTPERGAFCGAVRREDDRHWVGDVEVTWREILGTVVGALAPQHTKTS